MFSNLVIATCFSESMIDYKLEPNGKIVVECFGYHGHYFNMQVQNGSKIKLVFIGFNDNEILHIDHYYDYLGYNLRFSQGAGGPAKILMINENQYDVYISFSFDKRKEDVEEENRRLAHAFIFTISIFIFLIAIFLIYICISSCYKRCVENRPRDGYDLLDS